MHFVSLFHYSLCAIGVLNAAYIPPEVDLLTDEENIDENEQLNEISLDTDIAGTFEIDISDHELFDESDEEPLAEKRRKLIRMNVPKSRETMWEKKEITRTRLPVPNEIESIHLMKESLEGKTPLEIFFLFFDEELLSMIVDFSLEYARSNNRPEFDLNVNILKNFLGILILSGYHILPQTDLYWSRDEDKGVDIVRKCMSRNTFRNIKRNLHFSDNAHLDKSDKFAKLRPLFDAMNIRNKQFGIFAHNLSIDEQMVPYFGRHSCKMFIKGKPVRFGFKLWCLCSSEGYLFSFIPYGGAKPENEKSPYGLGGQVVLDLLDALDNPLCYRIFFDNYFSSYRLFEKLYEMQYFATGTMRDNRTNKCPLENMKSFKKRERGAYDFAVDENIQLTLVRWNDNAIVTVASNNFSVEPLANTKRFNRKERKDVQIPQPDMIKQYNTYMGGVDLHDNAIANYRTTIRGKKWWWPLFINTLDSTVANCWKLYRKVNSSNMSQLDFKSYIAVRLLKSDDASSKKSTVGRPSKEPIPSEVRLDRVGHVIMKHPDKARRRCKQCKSHTIYLCAKCQIHLHTDCFVNYHT